MRLDAKGDRYEHLQEVPSVCCPLQPDATAPERFMSLGRGPVFGVHQSLPVRNRRQRTNGRRQTTTSRTTWRATDHGEPNTWLITPPNCLSATVARLT